MNIQFAVAAACMILCLFPTVSLHGRSEARWTAERGHCVRSLYEYVKANEPISGLPSPVERIIHKLADYGDAVVPSLVDLLADPDVEVTDMAGAALRETKSSNLATCRKSSRDSTAVSIGFRPRSGASIARKLPRGGIPYLSRGASPITRKPMRSSCPGSALFPMFLKWQGVESNAKPKITSPSPS